MSSFTDILASLSAGISLSEDDYLQLLDHSNAESDGWLAERAVEVRKRHFGNAVFIRGLLEISSYCRNDCLYCGLRRSNTNAQRYRLSPERILSCADAGYAMGFRTIVLQGGEDLAGYSKDDICRIIEAMKSAHPDLAITLSLGERDDDSYAVWKSAGADRYLLRHETADAGHYAALHPADMSWQHRLDCLQRLRDLGYQTGCGFMVGSPFQTNRHLAKDLKFISDFKPEMCGIGPFIPQKDTPFAKYPAGTVELTCRLLSIIRLIHPRILLPATTALGSIHPEGRELGILSGANVVMPNLSPSDVRAKYAIYDNKLSADAESAQGLEQLRQRLRNIGYEIVVSRGDYK